jgi:hypothetical protein
MLDVVSPSAAGESGKGLLIPRVTAAQRTTADAGLAGGLLDAAGDLRGGAARGLLVYQTDGAAGFYYNTSATATPSWLWLRGDTSPADLTLGRAGVANPGKIAFHDNQAGDDFTVTLQAPNTVAANVAFTLPAADGTAGQAVVTDGAGNLSWATAGGAATLPIAGTVVTIGDSATTDTNGIAIGVSANGTTTGLAIGYMANGNNFGTGVGYQANANTRGVAMGYMANAYPGTGLWSGAVSIGYRANAYPWNGKQSGGVAIGYQANARQNATDNYGVGAVAVGWGANGYVSGVGIGRGATGYYQGVAVGMLATGSSNGVAVGYKANGYVNGTSLGFRANSGNQGYAFSKGSYSRCMRYNEEWKGADTLSEDPATGQLSGYNKFGYGQCNVNGTTATATATELFLGGVAGKRFALQDNSGVCFTAYTVAINTATGDTSAWQQAGLIKRRTGAATTALVGSVTTLMSNMQGTLTGVPALTADTTNGALKVTVTGVAASTVRWNTMITYSETRE